MRLLPSLSATLPDFDSSAIAVPILIPGDCPCMAKTVSLVRPSGAYSEIMRFY